MSRADPVTDQAFRAIASRDRGCVPALYLGAPGLCRDRYGRPIDPYAVGRMTVEHVRDEAAMGGHRAPSDEGHMLLACWAHGVQGWELRHKDLERGYLRDPRSHQAQPLRRCCGTCR